MIINLSDAPFKAFITVTYPNGTCTVSNGTKTYTHSGGGTHTFTVNKKGTWTVKSTPSDKAEGGSSSVSITSRGQTESVTLKHKLYLFKNSAYANSFTGKAYTAYAYGSTMIDEDKDISSSQFASFPINNGYDYAIKQNVASYCKQYSKLNISLTRSSGTEPNHFGLATFLAEGLNNNSSDKCTNAIIYTSLSSNKSTTLSLNVSGVTNSTAYVHLRVRDTKGTISNIWFET